MNVPAPVTPTRVPNLAWLAAVLLSALTAGQAAAQPSVTVSFGRALNAVSSADSLTSDGRRTTGGSIDAEQTLASERLRLFYSLDAGDYTTDGDWRYYQNDAGATWRLRKAGISGPAIFTGATVSWRTNGSSWAAADYRALGLFLNAEWTPRTTQTFRAGYRADIRAFPDMPALDQVEHEGFGSLLVNLPSKTTLIAEVRAGAKRYDVIEPASLVTAPSTTASTATTQTGMQPGLSHGRGIGAMSQSAGLVMSSSGTLAAGAIGGTAGQLTLLGRVGQSLADRTGITLQYVQRVSFGALPTAVVTTPALFFDDGVYDDPFASDARTVRGSIKHVRPNGMALEASGAWTGKDYRGTSALDVEGLALPGGDLRADRIWRAGAAWTVPLLCERTGPLGLEVVVDYQFTQHRSNDAFYNYSSHAVGLGLSVSY
jgi:hypothetical protein